MSWGQRRQSDVYGRFDLLLTTLLDQAYQRGRAAVSQRGKVFTPCWSLSLSALIANKYVVAHPLG